MIKVTLKTFSRLGFITLLMACNSSINNKLIALKSDDSVSKIQVEIAVVGDMIRDDSTLDKPSQIDSSAKDFVERLKKGGKLNSFLVEKWTLIYHEDNRCEGSTDGQSLNLKSTQIDSIIKLSVKNDGDGWACDQKEPKSYHFDFNLRKLIKQWDRLEITNDENQEKNIVYIFGGGEADYLKLYYNDKNLIVKLEYRSEDPG